MGNIFYKQGRKKEAIQNLETAKSLFIEQGMVAEANKIEHGIEYLHKSNNFLSHITRLLTNSPEVPQHIHRNISQQETQRQISRLKKQLDQNLEKVENSGADVKTILVLAANPKTTSPLRLDQEVRQIRAGLQTAMNRKAFNLQERWAVQVPDFCQALLDCQPQIVHFCGHGGGDGLVLEDETGTAQYVPTAALAELFQIFSQRNQKHPIECVILNACDSEEQATAISQHIPYVIGMNKAIGDKAAIEFVVGFYRALAAGESIDFAYKLGCHSIAMAGISENLTPILKVK